jgi:hypothetical protein
MDYQHLSNITNLEYCLVPVLYDCLYQAYTRLIPVENRPWTQYQDWIDWYESTQYQHYEKTKNKQGVCHTVALLFTLKSILRQKKNHGNSNISPCTNI